MTFKEYLRHPQPHLDALSAQAEAQRLADEETAYTKRWSDRRQYALSKYRDAMTTAKADLEWARHDRLNQDSQSQEYFLWAASQNRITAMAWYKRYRKCCRMLEV